jgi:hypothetical protein
MKHNDAQRKKLFSEHGHKSLKKYEHETLETKPEEKVIKPKKTVKLIPELKSLVVKKKKK